ncbi:MAG: type IX secretion system membrane protein PorP/SprF [Syntrophothermus sp.]
MRKKILLLILLLSGSRVFAQQDILFTQYMYNKIALNPAYAGSQDIFTADLLGRFQWVGIEGAPRKISFTAHTPLKNPRIGVGINSYRDEIGPYTDYGVTGVFAYRILFSATKLCFGISGGIKYAGIDWSLLNPKQAEDFQRIGQPKSKIVPDVDFGVYYYGRNFYAGLSSKHLVQSQMYVTDVGIDDTRSATSTKLLRHFYGMAGGVIPLGDNMVFVPSLLCKYVQNSPFQVDLNASFMLYDVLTLGVSYRTANALAVLAEINITKNLTLGYSYDLWFNSLEAYNHGSHEIRLGASFDLFDKDRMLTPRYF